VLSQVPKCEVLGYPFIVEELTAPPGSGPFAIDYLKSMPSLSERYSLKRITSIFLVTFGESKK
jgi:hypothetical protein